MKVKNQTQGIQKVQYIRVQLVKEGVREYPAPVFCGGTCYHGFLKDFFTGADREMVIVVCLDTQLRVNAINIVAVGTLNQALIHSREVFKPAILANAYQIILAHNHTSGDPTPSGEDMAMAEKIIAAGNLLDIRVADFVIAGEEDYYSLQDHKPSLFCRGKK